MPRTHMHTDVDREALMQRVHDAIEDAGLYEPSGELVEAIYLEAVRPIAAIVGVYVGLYGSDKVPDDMQPLARQCAFRIPPEAERGPYV